MLYAWHSARFVACFHKVVCSKGELDLRAVLSAAVPAQAHYHVVLHCSSSLLVLSGYIIACEWQLVKLSIC